MQLGFTVTVHGLCRLSIGWGYRSYGPPMAASRRIDESGEIRPERPILVYESDQVVELGLHDCKGSARNMLSEPPGLANRQKFTSDQLANTLQDGVELHGGLPCESHSVFLARRRLHEPARHRTEHRSQTMEGADGSLVDNHETATRAGVRAQLGGKTAEPLIQKATPALHHDLCRMHKGCFHGVHASCRLDGVEARSADQSPVHVHWRVRDAPQSPVHSQFEIRPAPL